MPPTGIVPVTNAFCNPTPGTTESDDDAACEFVEPLVEAMYTLAVDEGQDFARGWLLRNAKAAVSSRKPDGTYESPRAGTMDSQAWFIAHRTLQAD